MIHIIKYLKTESLADGTAAFYFEKPYGFSFVAGQFGEFTLLNPSDSDEKGNTRTFSFASAPEEEYIAIATRLRDTAFKRVLKGYKPGTELMLEAPLGIFKLHDDSERAAVFIAGGIGITPFRSMIISATQQKLPHKIFLFYSNRKPQDTAYLEELEELQKHNPNYKLISTMTKAEKEDNWSGETGYINAEMLKKYLTDALNPIYYLAGPEMMITSMRQMLNEIGVKNDDIRIEKFIGY